MKFPPLKISWDPPISHQHFLLYLPTSSQEIRHCCWCWFSSVKYSSLSGFSPTRSMSFDGLPKIRWKWNTLKWKQWSPKRQRSTRKANWKSPIKAGTQNKANTKMFARIRAPSIHTRPHGSGSRRTVRKPTGADVYSPCRHWPSCLLHSELPRASLEEVHLMCALQAGEGSWGRWSDSVC